MSTPLGLAEERIAVLNGNFIRFLLAMSSWESSPGSGCLNRSESLPV